MLRINTKYYRITEDLKLEELEYVGRDGNKYVFHDQYLAEVKTFKHEAESLNLSRIDSLTKLETMLEDRLAYVQDQLNRKREQFLPKVVMDIPKVHNRNRKEVHKYNEKTGKYMCTYLSMTDARKAINAPYHTSISNCCLGNRETAFGFRWSFKQYKNILDVV